MLRGSDPVRLALGKLLASIPEDRLCSAEIRCGYTSYEVRRTIDDERLGKESLRALEKNPIIKVEVRRDTGYGGATEAAKKKVGDIATRIRDAVA